MRRSRARSAAAITANPAADNSLPGSPVRAPGTTRTRADHLPCPGAVDHAGRPRARSYDEVRGATHHQTEAEPAEHVERRVRPKVDPRERDQGDDRPRDHTPAAA